MRTTRAMLAALLIGSVGAAVASETGEAPVYRVANFSADVTIPLGHRCMGILPIRAQTIDDPLEAHGFVLLCPEQPVVLVAIDWCEIRNGAYDQWRDALAKAAGTTRERVLVCGLHQHDAPVVDSGAQALLDEVGLKGELYDVEFHKDCIRRVADALRESLGKARRVTHLGLGQARVEKVASSRRVVFPDGRVNYNRYSSSGGDPFHSAAPDGEIDPLLKTLSFWDEETPVLALHSYATHPMSYYGKGGGSADFVGLARRQRHADDPAVHQIYVSGCSGDVTAGKYNDGTPPMRALLADRLYRGMVEAWRTTRRVPLRQIEFRNVPFDLPFHEGDEFTREALTGVLNNGEAKVPDRILAAMGLSSLDRIDRGQKIDLPCVDFGDAQMVLFPGESFVGYQLMAQRMRPDSFVFSIGYGECWPGYVPTNIAFKEKFNHDWRWAGPGSEEHIRSALQSVLLPPEEKSGRETSIRFEKHDGSLAIRIGEKPFATYVWEDEQVPRPHFRHVHSPSGIQVTRNHPPMKGKDLDDHPTYHPGIWMAFGDLSGADFWRNRARVRHAGFTREPQERDGRGSFAVCNVYETDGKVICTEECRIEIQKRPAGSLLICRCPELLRYGVEVLERLGLTYALVGSYGTLAYGEARFTLLHRSASAASRSGPVHRPSPGAASGAAIRSPFARNDADPMPAAPAPWESSCARRPRRSGPAVQFGSITAPLRAELHSRFGGHAASPQASAAAVRIVSEPPLGLKTCPWLSGAKRSLEQSPLGVPEPPS